MIGDGEGRSRERERWKWTWTRTYPHAGISGFYCAVSHTCHAIGFLVVKHNVGHGADFGTFVSDVFFDFQHGGWVFLRRG